MLAKNNDILQQKLPKLNKSGATNRTRLPSVLLFQKFGNLHMFYDMVCILVVKHQKGKI